MAAKALDFSRIELLLAKQKKTKDSLAQRLGLTTSGVRKGIDKSSLAMRLLPTLAEFFEMSEADFVAFLQGRTVGDLALEDKAEFYLPSKKLSDLKDPLDFIRGLMNRSEDLDNILGKK